MTRIVAVTRDALSALLVLEVGADQEGLVAPNAVTVAQHHFEPGSEVYGLWQGQEAVGLVAICDMGHPGAILEPDDDPRGIDLWRLMVAADHQGQGHGTAALDFVADRARSRGRTHVRTSAVPRPGSALPFYEGYGFRRTGAMDGAEVVLRLDLA